MRSQTLRDAAALIGAMAALAAVVAAVAIANQGSNCGGNSAALADVNLFFHVVRSAQIGQLGHRFDLAAPTPDERDELRLIADDGWLGGAGFLVAPLPEIRLSGPRRLLIVCDRPFRNVPRRLFGLAPPTHAAGFSDGSIGLITVAEFEGLDRSAFVPLERFLARTEAGTRQSPIIPTERGGE